MAFGNDMDAYQGGAATVGPLALVEKRKARSLFGITLGEVKLLIIAGIGFFMDAYDLFIINMIYAIILVAYYTKPAAIAALPISKVKAASAIDWGLAGGVLKASANLGNVLGQILFGFLGDTFGRSAVYGKELIIIIVGVIMIISVPDYLGGKGITIWMAAFRILMGIGIGGDYPMSASVVSDRSYMEKRGTLLAFIFSNQGWGNLIGAILAVIVIAGYKPHVVAGDFHKLSGAWRILQGLALIPAFGVLYFRLTLVESTRFTQARQIQDDPELLAKASAHGIIAADDDEDLKKHMESPGTSIGGGAENEAIGLKFGTIGKKAHNEFFEYFSEWRHFKILLGTTVTWFAVDVAFYGINLNQSTILSVLGLAQGEGDTNFEKIWSGLMRTATGNLIITCAGFLPGYFFTIALVERIGRKPIQYLGFAMNMLILGVLAGKFDDYKNRKGPILALFIFLQFFFNFGANATTFIVPAEVFPTRVRSAAHGVSAACGKLGAILSSLLFSYMGTPKPTHHISVGQQNVFWIFFAFSFLGLVFTALLPETMGRDADAIDRQELAEKYGVAGNAGNHEVEHEKAASKGGLFGSLRGNKEVSEA